MTATMRFSSNDWDFIVKLDGDLTLPSNYFEKCFEHFERDPKLGIGGGDIYHDIGGVQKLEANSQVPCPRRDQDLQESLLGGDRWLVEGTRMGHDR